MQIVRTFKHKFFALSGLWGEQGDNSLIQTITKAWIVYLGGTGGPYKLCRARLREDGHMVIVVAEGAGLELIAESPQLSQLDASGNRLFPSVTFLVENDVNAADLKVE